MPEFEWDVGKAIANWRKHGITFDQAVKAFNDPIAVDRIDDRENYGEERGNLVGICNGVVLHVTYTERDTCVRIISARRPERHE